MDILDLMEMSEVGDLVEMYNAQALFSFNLGTRRSNYSTYCKITRGIHLLIVGNIDRHYNFCKKNDDESTKKYGEDGNGCDLDEHNLGVEHIVNQHN